MVQRQAEAPASAGPERLASSAAPPVRATVPVVQRQTGVPASAGSSVRPTLDGQPPVTAPAGPVLPMVQREADASAGPPVRPAPGGQPAVARPAGSERPVVHGHADAPATAVPPAGPALPVVQRHADAAPATAPLTHPTPGPAPAHAPRPATLRPALGKPLRELPAGAAPFVAGAREGAAAPGLPVVQRQTPGAGVRPAPDAGSAGPGSRARERGGLGAPLPGLPPTAGSASEAPLRVPVAGRPGQPVSPAMPLRGVPAAQRAAVRVRPVPGGRTPRSAPVRRTRALLVARALTVRTGAAEGFSARASAAAGRPVVPATWRRDAPNPPGPGEARPVVQRVAAEPVAPPRPPAPLPARPAVPQGPAVPAGLVPEPASRAPVVRPHPPGTPRPGHFAAPVQRLAMPVVAEPVPEAGAPSGVLPPVAPRSVPSPPKQAHGAGVQRAVAHAGPAGVPVTFVQRQPARETAPERLAEPAAEPDVEDLARRLIDPVARLLRADLRRGRERSGRPYDGRR
ncbi:hypothetical protein ACWC1D_22575 [Streptomyces sp. NPDC001478]